MRTFFAFSIFTCDSTTFSIFYIFHFFVQQHAIQQHFHAHLFICHFPVGIFHFHAYLTTMLDARNALKATFTYLFGSGFTLLCGIFSLKMRAELLRRPENQHQSLSIMTTRTLVRMDRFKANLLRNVGTISRTALAVNDAAHIASGHC